MSLHRIPVPLFSRHSGSNAKLMFLCIHIVEYREEYDNSETTNAVKTKYLRFFNIANYFSNKKPECLNKCLFII